MNVPQTTVVVLQLQFAPTQLGRLLVLAKLDSVEMESPVLFVQLEPLLLRPAQLLVPNALLVPSLPMELVAQLARLDTLRPMERLVLT